MSNWFNRNSIHLIIAGIFIALASIYFSPAYQGKVLPQSDVQQAQFMAREIMEFKAIDGKGPLWTNSMFGGMPSYQIWAQYPYNITTYIIAFFTKTFPNPIGIVILYLLGAYLLFCTLKVNPWLAAAGALAFTFTTYNFVIIEAGHNNQALAISFFAPILAGIILTLRKNYLAGAGITAFFLALEIRSNHVQMTYYLFIALLILIGIELYHAIKSKQTNTFLKSIGWLAAAALLAVAVNAGTLWTTYEYAQESIRGKSNLTATDKSKPSSGGVDREYAYGWSQGVGESITFLIPNAYGGSSSSHIETDNSNVAKVLTEKGVAPEQAQGVAKQMPTYWGDKPGTSGPFYFGAIICFLFVLGLFIVQDRIKWWILGASLLSLFLAFGKNFPLISDLFFDYFPLYNKFRTVESNLAVAGLLVPILAILAVKEITLQDPKILLKKFFYSVYITGGILLIIIILPTLFFSFKGAGNEQFIQQFMQGTGVDRAFADAVGNALALDRASIARMDAFRSLVFVLIGAGLIWMLIKQKLKAEYIFPLLAIAVLIDMWGIDRRYVNNDQFIEKNLMLQQAQPRQVDQLIMKDATPDYRVFDMTTNPFTDARPSNFHNTIGGYHAAKLKRYQEVIEKQFNGSVNEDVLDMLNTKYVIMTDQTGQSQRMVNRETAAGNAWFVKKLVYVKNADQEMAAINSFNPKDVAFVDEKFKPMIDEKKVGFSPTGSIRLTSYRPDNLVYEYSADRDVIAVFAEVWYDKGWNAYVDGNKIDHFRADYILRAAQLPGGNHKLEFKFEPASYYTGEKISLVASILLIAAIAFAIYTETKKNKVVVA
jgi:hypothetical protein